MQYQIFARTEKGNFRENNEDSIVVERNVITDGSFFSSVNSPFLTAVCDGVGGINGGEVASFYVANSLSEIKVTDPESLKAKLLEADRDIINYGQENEELFGLQTTVCCLLVLENGRLFCINAGDSRLYFYKRKKAVQVSKDHSYVQSLFDKGDITKEELYTHPKKHIITSSIGNPYKKPEINVIEVCRNFSEGDVVILCSDGVSDFVGEREIEVAMSLDIPFDEKINALLELAMERGSTDNLSIVGVKLN